MILSALALLRPAAPRAVSNSMVISQAYGGGGNSGATMNVEAFTSFTDPGATAHDGFGALAVTVSGSVDVNVPGTYTLSYTATNF